MSDDPQGGSPMLDLYHAEPNGASARVLICLEEKGLRFAGHYVDALALEQYRSPLAEIEPSGDLPVLVRDGAAYAGASAVCELLEEVFPQRPLMPADPRGRWAVRVWQKYVDDGFAASVSELAWEAYGARSMSSSSGRVAAEVERLVPPRERPAWRAALAGYDEEQLARARSRVAAAIAKVEAAIEGAAWLVGSACSLADVAMFSYFNYLPALCPDRVNASATPHAMRWLRALADRPAVKAALARGRGRDPFAVAIPAPEQIRWG